jgi:hypothetical protein
MTRREVHSHLEMAAKKMELRRAAMKRAETASSVDSKADFSEKEKETLDGALDTAVASVAARFKKP